MGLRALLCAGPFAEKSKSTAGTEIKTKYIIEEIQMKFFDKIRKQDSKKTIWIEHLNIDTGNWFQVFSACLGKMMAIQTACSEQVVKGQDWNVDFSEGVILFGNQKYPLQFIGSEATTSNTWLWGWENINGFSEKIIQVAMHTKEVGEYWNLEPLTTAKFILDKTFNGHNLSIVTCGLADQYCYYRGPHSGGAIFVAFSGVPDSVFACVDVQKFVSITTQCIQQSQIDHKIFVEGFLSWNHTKYEWNHQTLIAHFQQDLEIEFEQINGFSRICSMNTILFGKS